MTRGSSEHTPLPHSLVPSFTSHTHSPGSRNLLVLGKCPIGEIGGREVKVPQKQKRRARKKGHGINREGPTDYRQTM